MLEYGFIENVDYCVISQKREIGIGKGLTDHQLTLDMAKEISMIQRNEKGRQARKYFINIEKEYKSEIIPRLKEEKEIFEAEIKLLKAEKELFKVEKELNILLNKKQIRIKDEKIKKLKDYNFKYATVSQVADKIGISYNHDKLIKYSKVNNLIIMRVKPNNYDSMPINSYPGEAWLKCYGVDLKEVYSEDINFFE